MSRTGLEVFDTTVHQTNAWPIDELVAAVLRTLNAYVTTEQLHEVRRALGAELQELWPEPAWA